MSAGIIVALYICIMVASAVGFASNDRRWYAIPGAIAMFLLVMLIIKR